MPVLGISPIDIKKSVTLALKEYLILDREEVSKNTALNFICKSLGFSGGYAGYKNSYPTTLKPFMEDNNLLEYEDLISFEGLDPLVTFSSEQVADRLFQSSQNSPFPKRIFTGFNINQAHLLDLALFDKSVEMEYAPMAFSGLSSLKLVKPTKGDKTVVNNLKKLSKQERLARFTHGDFISSYRFKYKKNNFHIASFVPFSNLIGTQYLELEESCNHDFLAQIYYISMHDETEKNKEKKLDNLKCDFIHYLLSQSEKGWLDIIPFNENLIFLKGPKGKYDFVFKSLKKSYFKHNIYEPYLKNSDMPITENSYDFERWLYFPCNNGSDARSPYDGWQEYDKHLAELDFYQTGGTVNAYPGTSQNL